MKKISFLVLLLLFISFQQAFASSSYTLPYPGTMPGNKLYSVSEIFDQMKQYYTFGDYARFKYHLSQSDKYLVEAKTLFEYGQYLLAQKSLEKSDKNFKLLKPILNSAKKGGKNTVEKEGILYSAAQKHIEVLQKLKDDLPESFLWQDEKKEPVNIYIHRLIDESVNNKLDI